MAYSITQDALRYRSPEVTPESPEDLGDGCVVISLSRNTTENNQPSCVQDLGHHAGHERIQGGVREMRPLDLLHREPERPYPLECGFDGIELVAAELHPQVFFAREVGAAPYRWTFDGGESLHGLSPLSTDLDVTPYPISRLNGSQMIVPRFLILSMMSSPSGHKYHFSTPSSRSSSIRFLTSSGEP